MPNSMAVSALFRWHITIRDGLTLWQPQLRHHSPALVLSASTAASMFGTIVAPYLAAI